MTSPLLPVERVTDLNDDEHRQGHRLWLWVVEDLTVDPLKALVLHEALHVMRLTKAHTTITLQELKWSSDSVEILTIRTNYKRYDNWARL